MTPAARAGLKRKVHVNRAIQKVGRSRVRRRKATVGGFQVRPAVKLNPVQLRAHRRSAPYSRSLQLPFPPAQILERDCPEIARADSARRDRTVQIRQAHALSCPVSLVTSIGRSVDLASSTATSAIPQVRRRLAPSAASARKTKIRPVFNAGTRHRWPHGIDANPSSPLVLRRSAPATEPKSFAIVLSTRPAK